MYNTHTLLQSGKIMVISQQCKKSKNNKDEFSLIGTLFFQIIFEFTPK